MVAEASTTVCRNAHRIKMYRKHALESRPVVIIEAVTCACIEAFSRRWPVAANECAFACASVREANAHLQKAKEASCTEARRQLCLFALLFFWWPSANAMHVKLRCAIVEPQEALSRTFTDGAASPPPEAARGAIFKLMLVTFYATCRLLTGFFHAQNSLNTGKGDLRLPAGQPR